MRVRRGPGQGELTRCAADLISERDELADPGEPAWIGERLAEPLDVLSPAAFGDPVLILARQEAGGEGAERRETQPDVLVQAGVLHLDPGPVVAGIVGTSKFAYDLWGDPVNVASRMESEGIPGAIQVTDTTYHLIRDDFVCEPRGPVHVKGRGEMETYVVVSRVAPVSTGQAFTG
jgi:class 3 adenylate cyclase